MTFKCLWGTECHDVLLARHGLAKRNARPSSGRLTKATLTFTQAFLQPGPVCTSEQECVSLAKPALGPQMGDKGCVPQHQATPEQLGSQLCHVELTGANVMSHSLKNTHLTFLPNI